MAKKKVVKPPPSRMPEIVSDVTGAVVDQLPPARSSSPRAAMYVQALRDVREKVGVGRHVQLATFQSAGGAANVKRAFERGERAVDGKVADWQFDARRVEGGGSVLYCMLKPAPERRAEK